MRRDLAVVPLPAKGGTGLGTYPCLVPGQNGEVLVDVFGACSLVDF